MNILHIFPGKVWGGAEQYVLDLGKHLEAQGHRVSYLSYAVAPIVERLPAGLNHSTLPFFSSIDLYSAWKMAKQIDSLNIDLLHIHDKRFLLLAIWAKKWAKHPCKVVLTRHIARKSAVCPLFRWAYRQLHRMVFVSQLSKTLWHEANEWFPSSLCTVILNSIPPVERKEEAVPQLREQFRIPIDVPLLIFTGRVRKSKGCATLIEALAQVSDMPFHLVFIGQCKPVDYDKKLKEIAEMYGIADRISFYGFSKEVRSLIQQADIGVAPSIVKEACPLSPMEFMQAGKPIVTTNNGGQTEYVSQEESGFLVPPKSVEALSQALRKLLEQPALREKMGTSGLHYFQSHLTYEHFISKVLAVYTAER